MNPEFETGTVYYRHYRNRAGKLIATICQIDDDLTGDSGIGLSICSELDNFSRVEGRKLSKQRAEKAFLSKRNTLPIRMRPEYSNVWEAITHADICRTLRFPFKSIFISHKGN